MSFSSLQGTGTLSKITIQTILACCCCLTKDLKTQWLKTKIIYYYFHICGLLQFGN